MTVTPQRHATYNNIMPVEELFVHLQRLIDRGGGTGLGFFSGLVGGRETRVEESKQT